MSLPTIAMFWDGPPLGFIERLCSKSFVDAGHPVVMFSYGKLDGLPNGIETAPASDILPDPKSIVRHERTGSPAPHSDKFRYHLLAKNDGLVWADTDAYCLKPFLPKDGYFFGRETEKVVASGVMALPAQSPTLGALIEFCEDEYAIPPWMMPRHRQEMEERAEAGDPMHVSEMPWGRGAPKPCRITCANTMSFATLCPRMFSIRCHSKIGGFTFARLGKHGNAFRRIRSRSTSTVAACANGFGTGSRARRLRVRSWPNWPSVMAWPPELCVSQVKWSKYC